MLVRTLSTLVFSASVLCLLECKTVDVGQPDQTGTTEPAPIDTTKFICSGKNNCSAMTSCPEARFYLKNCPFVNIDGDADGIPCEDQWCGH